MNVKVFGERHTATNALQAFLTQNFDTFCYYYSFLGWKHRRAPKQREWKRINYTDTLFIFTVRDPYTWVEAMYREPYNYHHPQLSEFPFDRFLTHPIEDYENVLQMWNEKYEGYLRMSEEVPNSLIVRMEDFVADQKGIYDLAAPYLVAKGEFQAYNKYASGTGVSDRKVGGEAVKRSLTKEQYATINSQIDPAIVKKLGYEMVNFALL